VVQDGAAISLDFKDELCAGCGVCVEACPMDVITLSGKGEDLNMVRNSVTECAETVHCYPPLHT
jgi:4Fe-4S ferredoxin